MKGKEKRDGRGKKEEMKYTKERRQDDRTEGKERK